MSGDLLPPVEAKLTANTTDFRKGMTEAKGEMSSVEKAGGANFSKLAAGVATSVALMGGAVIGFAADSISKFQNTASAIDDMQDVTGESAESMSKLKYAFNSWGVSDEAMEKSLLKLSKTVGANNDVFAQYGIAIKDAQGNTLPMSEIVGNAADVFKTMPDGIDKSNLAMTLFGKSGTEMLDVMSQGKDGIAALGDEAERYGLVLGEKDVKANEANAKSQRQMHAAWEGLQLQIGKHLMPMLAKVTGFLAENMPGAIATVKGALKFLEPGIQAIGDLFGLLVGWVQDHWTQISTTVQTALGYVQGYIDTWVAYVSWIWDHFGSQIISALELAWNTVKAVVSAALSVVKGIIEVVTGIIHGDWSKVWQGIKDILTGIWDAMMAYVEYAIGAIGVVISTAWEAIKIVTGVVWDGIKAALSLVWEGIKGAASLAWEGVKGAIMAPINLIGGLLQVVWDGIKTAAKLAWTILSGAAFIAWEAVKATIMAPINVVSGLLSTAWDTIKSVAKTAWEGVKSAIEPIVNTIKGIIQGLIDKVQWAIDKFIELKNFAFGGVKVDTSKIPGFNTQSSGGGGGGVPRLAGGGLLTGPTAFIGGEYPNAGSDPEIVAPSSKIRQIIDEALAASGAGVGAGQIIHVNATALNVPDLAREVGAELSWVMKTRAA